MTRPNSEESVRPDTDSDEAVLLDLLGWGKVLASLVQVLDPFCQLDDLSQTDHPLRESEQPLGTVVRCFGKNSSGEGFLLWWCGGDDSLPKLRDREESESMVPLGLARRWRAAELLTQAEVSFKRFEEEWLILADRLRNTLSGQENPYSQNLSEEDWSFLCRKLPSKDRRVQSRVAPRLDDAIERVRSYFAPLESPLFGMDSELLAHHVNETIPHEGPIDVTPVVPLFGKGKLPAAFPSTAHLPAHLRVILQRLVRAQENEDIVTALLATLEAVDFSFRFTVGLAQGTLAQLTDSDFAGDFNPTTQQLLEDLAQALATVRQHRDDSRTHALLHLTYRGSELHPFLAWGGIGAEQRLLAWMIESDESIRNDNPARAAVLLSEMMEHFNDWISEMTLLCSSWDLVTHVRQDGYLQISLARGEVWLSCKPLIDPTRYSVWLDRSELTLVNTGGTLHGGWDARQSVALLDKRIAAADDDPPFLKEQLTTLVRAHQQGQVLPLGRSLFFGLEYLVRLHASLAGGLLRHFYEESTLVDPVLKPGGSLEHTIFFLSYSQRLMASMEREEAKMLSQVFFDDKTAREFTLWLGVDGGVPGPLQGLLGWSLSLMRPDAKTRLDEVRGQVERLSGLFADLLEESRRLWRSANLKTDADDEGAEAVVLTFPSGLAIRGLPDVLVGPRLERGRRSVVVSSGANGREEFSDWGEPAPAPEVPEPAAEPTGLDQEDEEPVEEPSWPSFFDDEPSESDSWSYLLLDGISRICQARSFSGPDARPRKVAQEVADVITRLGSDGASVLFCLGDKGCGKTFLCRTLTNPNCSPLPDDFPVLYLRVDRFPRTRLATVVERLNDHIASEHSLERFEWCSVPIDSLKSLGTEVTRLAADLAALGLPSELLGNRLSSYLRHLKKLNGDRQFLLILDGFQEVPKSIIPSALPRGVHILITGTSAPEIAEEETPFLERHLWNLSEVQRETFARQLHGLSLNEEEKEKAWRHFRGSLFSARVFRDLRELDEDYPVSSSLLEDMVATIRAKYPNPEKHAQFLRFLSVLGLYERPVPLNVLQRKVADAEVVHRGLQLFPSLFAFWDEPVPNLGLGHSELLELVRPTGAVEATATALAETFLQTPKRGELLPALSWFGESQQTAVLVERFFTEAPCLQLWREELATLQEQGLFFQRVALLDAAAGPLAEAVQSGSGHLREELAWVYNARGLSLLELGLVEEAVPDFQQAIDLFSQIFEDGDLQVLQAMASAYSRKSEAALRNQDLDTALESSTRALELLSERLLTEQEDESLAELRIRVLLQSARVQHAVGSNNLAMERLALALPELTMVPDERVSRLSGECFLTAAQALTSLGQDEEAVERATTAVTNLLVGSTAELGLQALTLRARLYQRMGRRYESERDYQRALSILRYQVAVGRLDLEPLLAYTAAQAVLVSDDPVTGSAEALSEFVEWARRRIRYEGRTDLRGLLALLLLTRAAKWKESGDYSQSAQDLRGATEQYDLLSREVTGGHDQPVWFALRESFRNLTALYLSLDEPHLALICGRRALELGRRAAGVHDSSEESLELPLQSLAGPPAEHTEEEEALSEVRFFQLGKLYFHLGEAARRVGLSQDGAIYFQRSARAFASACSSFSDIPELLAAEYALVLKFAAQAAYEDGDPVTLEQWLDELASLPDGYLTDFDQYRYWRWSGYLQQEHGDFDEGVQHLERALAGVRAMEEHPRWRSLEAEVLLDLGRAYSLRQEHDIALDRLEQASVKAHDALFMEGEESRELMVLCALHAAVALLRAGRTANALEKLRILVSLRPGHELFEVESLAKDWAEAWDQAKSLGVMELLKALGQLSELGDWLLRTSLGTWYRTLASELVRDPEFDSIIMSSSRVDRILETYLVLTFSVVGQDTRPESHPELDKLLAAKFRAFDSENRDLEAELIMGHLLPCKLTPESGKLLLRRSEMALLRGDRGLAIVDLMRAIDVGGDCRVRAHLRLAEFLQSRALEAAVTHHLLKALQATDTRTPELSALCGRFNRVVSRLSKAGVRLSLSFLQEYFRVLGCLEPEQLKPNLDAVWLRPAREQSEWPQLLRMTLNLMHPWQKGGHDKASDWLFLEELVDRTVLCQGRIELDLLESLGSLLTGTLAGADQQNQELAGRLWERFVSFLPGLGKRNALALLQRLFELALRTQTASNESHAEEFMRRLEEEKRILIQPR